MNSTETLNWTIYRIVNPDGQYYIGKTMNINSRLYSHKNLKRQSNKHLKESIIKHGWGSHVVEVLEEFSGVEPDSNSKEMFWIRSYMSNRNKWPDGRGMNLTDGGKNIIGYKHDETTKRKIGASNSLKVRTDEVKARISNSLKGVKQERHRAVKTGNAHKKPLLVYGIDGKFIKEVDSSKDAYFFIYGKEGSNGHIGEVAHGLRDSYRGFIFKFKNKGI